MFLCQEADIGPSRASNHNACSMSAERKPSRRRCVTLSPKFPAPSDSPGARCCVTGCSPSNINPFSGNAILFLFMYMLNCRCSLPSPSSIRCIPTVDAGLTQSDASMLIEADSRALALASARRWLPAFLGVISEPSSSLWPCCFWPVIYRFEHHACINPPKSSTKETVIYSGFQNLRYAYVPLSLQVQGYEPFDY